MSFNSDIEQYIENENENLAEQYRSEAYDPNEYSCCEFYSTEYQLWRDWHPTCMGSYPMPQYRGNLLKNGGTLFIEE